MALKPFRTVPKDIVEWTDWMNQQSLFSVVRGTVKFNGVATKDVTFATELKDTGYVIYIEPANSETFYISNKTTTGFRITSSASDSVTTVNWVKI